MEEFVYGILFGSFMTYKIMAWVTKENRFMLELSRKYQSGVVVTKNPTYAMPIPKENSNNEKEV